MQTDRPAAAATLRAMAGRGTRHRGFRMPDRLYEAALAKAKRRGETVTDVVRAALERYVAEDDGTGGPDALPSNAGDH